MQLICMHCNARKCITFRMHTYGNAHECIIVRMHQNATHVHALECVYMHGNAHECITCSKCMIMQQRMEMHRIIDA